MGVSVDTAGGYTVPEGFVANLETRTRAYGGVRNVALPNSSGTAIAANPLVLAEQAGRHRAAAGALAGREHGHQHRRGTAPTMGRVIFGRARSSAAAWCRPPASCSATARSNLAAEIGRMVGIRLGRVMSGKFTIGTGQGIQPTGIVTKATAATLSSGVAYTASATAITFDEVLDLHLLGGSGVAVRARGPASCSTTWLTKSHPRKLKDGMGRYLVSMGSVNTGEPDRIWCFPADPRWKWIPPLPPPRKRCSSAT